MTLVGTVKHTLFGSREDTLDRIKPFCRQFFLIRILEGVVQGFLKGSLGIDILVPPISIEFGYKARLRHIETTGRITFHRLHQHVKPVVSSIEDEVDETELWCPRHTHQLAYLQPDHIPQIKERHEQPVAVCMTNSSWNKHIGRSLQLDLKGFLGSACTPVATHLDGHATDRLLIRTTVEEHTRGIAHRHPARHFNGISDTATETTFRGVDILVGGFFPVNSRHFHHRKTEGGQRTD